MLPIQDQNEKRTGEPARTPKVLAEGRRSLIRPADGTAAAFLVPVMVMVIIFIQRKIFPFGEESFLRTDMYHQYAPFFSEFQYKLQNGGSLLYSWDVGMGINFSALYAYYLASPFNWLLLICPKKLVIEFMTYMIVAKIGLCGLTMHYYLRKHYRTFSSSPSLCWAWKSWFIMGNGSFTALPWGCPFCPTTIFPS